MTLESYLINHIKTHGSMDIGTYMGLALGHPKYGYYMKQDPFGAAGDFTTAPEISQMFGEMIGAWIANLWTELGKPSKFTLLECGPGRGTLMRDILRVLSGIPKLIDSLQVFLLEISPVLKEVQKKNLNAYNIKWIEHVSEIPSSQDTLLIGNEFLDALPFKQYIRDSKSWAERLVSYSDIKGFYFSARPVSEVVFRFFPDYIRSAPEHSVFEVSLQRESFVQNIFKHIDKSVFSGAVLIDYGHLRSGLSDTLQALYKHRYCSVFEHIGDADITSHVDFDALGRCLSDIENLRCYFTDQGNFLKNLGIEHRAALLSKHANDVQKKDILQSLHRLTNPSEMGTLFKVMGAFRNEPSSIAGFQ